MNSRYNNVKYLKSLAIIKVFNMFTIQFAMYCFLDTLYSHLT